jgi:asparagine synthase (glutamine-hydrolysing)
VCGIAGLASRRGAIAPERLRTMSATLVHRGPDSDGQLVDGPVGLAARRLSIIDLETGDQPIANEDGTVHVVQNGELYNYRELRARLEAAGHRFATRSDTEVLVHLYEQHGDAFAERLRGMFAVALWDATRRRLVLARDPFGIKPLYYRVDGEGLAFASELRALPAARSTSMRSRPSSPSTRSRGRSRSSGTSGSSRRDTYSSGKTARHASLGSRGRPP